jgi:CRISPR-associated protein (TIGR03986 family)
MSESKGQLEKNADGYFVVVWNEKKNKYGKPVEVLARDIADVVRDTANDGVPVDVIVERDKNGVIVRVLPTDQLQKQGADTEMSKDVLNPDQWTTHHASGAFHNPYNFVPAIPRVGLPVDSELGDRPVTGHDALAADRWTGRIRVSMTVKTPLLLPDAARVSEPVTKGHKVFPVRQDSDGRPIVAATSVRGMLRSAYEAVTDSRMGVFSGHDDRLGWRKQAREGTRAVPVRIEKIDGKWWALLCTGTSAMDSDGSPVKQSNNKQFMYAAWLPTYYDHSSKNVRLGVHEQEVSFRVTQQEHPRKGNMAPFDYWQVLPPGAEGGTLYKGWICMTNLNIDRKHDERVFFNGSANPVRVPLSDDVVQAWENLIKDYRRANQNDITNGKERPPALRDRRCVYSRHIQQNVSDPDEIDTKLHHGLLCYAHVHRNGNEITVENLYPVMISRDLQDTSPGSLLHHTLKPASNLDKLSPADRVFGWVGDERTNGAETKQEDKENAYRGNLRVGAVACLSDSKQAIKRLTSDAVPSGLPLAILGAPKPEQARFYVGRNINGASQRDGLEKESSNYSDGKGLRGRKVYPHQNVPGDYWEKPWEDRTQQTQMGWYQDYRRPKKNGQEQLDNQNHSVQAWVVPGTKFSFDLDVMNLSDVELGALLWLLQLNERTDEPQYFFKLGSGKPLGFGSVSMSIDHKNTHLAKGNLWVSYYASLTAPIPSSELGGMNDPVSVFRTALTSWFHCEFERVPFIQAFLGAMRGYNDGKSTHYPRTTLQPSPEGEGFDWFSANERGPKVSLADLTDDQGLPALNNPQRDH